MDIVGKENVKNEILSSLSNGACYLLENHIQWFPWRILRQEVRDVQSDEEFQGASFHEGHSIPMSLQALWLGLSDGQKIDRLCRECISKGTKLLN